MPAYIHAVKETIAEETKLLEEIKRKEEGAGKDRTRELSKKEKDDIVAGLRSNLKELEIEYRALPVTLNTFGQKARY